MVIKAPSQLFDGSDFEAVNAAPAPKGRLETPLSPAQQTGLDFDFDVASTPEEFEIFDWDAFNRRIADHLPQGKGGDKRIEHLREIAGCQLWMCHRMPEESLRWMLQDQPGKLLWEYLHLERLKPVKHDALRGFQQTPGSLRREPVIKRLVAWFKTHPYEIHLLLVRWGSRLPAPLAVEAVEFQPDEATLRGRIPSMLRSFGLGATVAAVVYSGKPRVFKFVADLITEGQFAEIIENAPPYDAEDLPTIEQKIAELEPEPDSDAARFWQARSQQATRLLQNAEQTSGDNERLQTALEKATARLKTLEADLEAARKRERQKELQAAKKLEQVERKWAAKHEEMGRVETRHERKFRKLQLQVEELEADNKRQKKQLRQGVQSREEERRKVVALDARVAELTAGDAPKSAPNKTSVEAISSPPTTQDAPNRPVKVAAPSPLDEVFAWTANSRRIRVTAREVRRLIDKNDEERVTDVMLALEELQGSDLNKSLRFLARLGEAGRHYPRVLTHRTTRVLVDASNVARFCPNKYGKGHLAHLISMRQELQRLDCWPIIFVADASLPHNIDQPGELREMARNGEIILTDKGVEADEILAREARKTGAYVVTNDAKFFYKVSPDYEPPRITFRVHDDLVVVDAF